MKLSAFLSIAALTASLYFLSASGLRAEDSGSTSGSEGIEKMMTPAQFEAAGLDKLSSKQLQNLNNWLQGYRETTVKTTELKAVKSGKMIPNMVVSRVDGTFFGLTGHTIITLQDGSKWKQANESDRYRSPGGENLGAAVFKAGLFGYRMRIEGTPEFYVDRISK